MLVIIGNTSVLAFLLGVVRRQRVIEKLVIRFVNILSAKNDIVLRAIAFYVSGIKFAVVVPYAAFADNSAYTLLSTNYVSPPSDMFFAPIGAVLLLLSSII